MSRLPVSPSRPALPVKGQGGSAVGRLIPRRTAIVGTSANLALTSPVNVTNAKKIFIPIRYPYWNGTEKCNLKCREWSQSRGGRTVSVTPLTVECEMIHGTSVSKTVKLQWSYSEVTVKWVSMDNMWCAIGGNDTRSVPFLYSPVRLHSREGLE